MFKLLIDLRSVDYGHSGGIENYAYYLIDSIKSRDVKIILDVAPSSFKNYKDKYENDKNVEIIYDPIQWVVRYSKSSHKIANILSNLLGKTIFKWFNIEFSRRRKRWANSIQADLAYYPFHLDEIQHFNMPVVTTIHALLPEYSEFQIKAIESHIKNAKAIITSWNYPYKELIEKYPSRKDDWHLIHYIAVQNVSVNNQIKVVDIINPFYLYVSFFIQRKNHLNLVHAYSIAKRKNDTLPKLVLVGSGEPLYKQKVKDMIQQYDLKDSIYVFDYLADEKISYLYYNCKAVIAPTLWEAASGAALEASYCGKPVLCSDVPPLKDFAEYFNLKMSFFDPNSIEDIAKTILDFENDSEELTNAAKQNAIILRKYDIKYFGDSIIKLFENVIEQNKFSEH